MILNPFKKVVSWYELKHFNDDEIKNMLITISKVGAIKLLPIKERKNYVIVRQQLIKEAKRRGLIV